MVANLFAVTDKSATHENRVVTESANTTKVPDKEAKPETANNNIGVDNARKTIKENDVMLEVPVEGILKVRGCS